MQAMPDDVVCIVKQHPFVHQTMDIAPQWADWVLDLTGQDHINDLLLLTDLLITDYSSCIFEAALLDVPMLFYAFDKEEYMASRDFYFAYEEMVPGPVTENFREMTNKAARMISGRWSPEEEEEPTSLAKHLPALTRRMEDFRRVFLGALDGHSTERVYQYIKENYLS